MRQRAIANRDSCSSYLILFARNAIINVALAISWVTIAHPAISGVGTQPHLPVTVHLASMMISSQCTVKGASNCALSAQDSLIVV